MPSFQWTSAKAIEMLNKFKFEGLISHEWTFGWNRRKNALALCSYSKKQISLSTYYVLNSSEEEVIDSIGHELVHAICGHQAGHGPVWKAMCRKYGVKPQRCSDREISVPAKYNGHCPVCSTVYKCNRVLKSMDKRLCGKRGCKSKELKQYIIWK